MANRILRRAQRKELETILWLQLGLESAGAGVSVVRLVGTVKASPECRKLLILSDSKRSFLLILLGQSKQMIRNISEISKWWKGTTGGRLILVAWKV